MIFTIASKSILLLKNNIGRHRYILSHHSKQNKVPLAVPLNQWYFKKAIISLSHTYPQNCSLTAGALSSVRLAYTMTTRFWYFVCLSINHIHISILKGQEKN